MALTAWIQAQFPTKLDRSKAFHTCHSWSSSASSSHLHRPIRWTLPSDHVRLICPDQQRNHHISAQWLLKHPSWSPSFIVASVSLPSAQQPVWACSVFDLEHYCCELVYGHVSESRRQWTGVGSFLPLSEGWNPGRQAQWQVSLPPKYLTSLGMVPSMVILKAFKGNTNWK